ncbi:hypothetical protein FrEUN1fDRAFT_1287 [Parafrankia sp. EUN1f]|nr:hypothetical protein FrEUN1fDRAFT_1287 [Parafrankia sp. EUN1f]
MILTGDASDLGRLANPYPTVTVESLGGSAGRERS